MYYTGACFLWVGCPEAVRKSPAPVQVCHAFALVSGGQVEVATGLLERILHDPNGPKPTTHRDQVSSDYVHRPGLDHPK